jgi:hypothetical protein
MNLYCESQEELAIRGAELAKLKARLECCTCQTSLQTELQRKSLEKQAYDEMQDRSHTGMSLDAKLDKTKKETSEKTPYNYRYSEPIINTRPEVLSQKQSRETISRQSQSTSGWSEFSELFDDCPLLDICKEEAYEPMCMSDAVSSLRADVLVLSDSPEGGLSDSSEPDEEGNWICKCLRLVSYTLRSFKLLAMV